MLGFTCLLQAWLLHPGQEVSISKLSYDIQTLKHEYFHSVNFCSSQRYSIFIRWEKRSPPNLNALVCWSSLLLDRLTSSADYEPASEEICSFWTALPHAEVYNKDGYKFIKLVAGTSFLGFEVLHHHLMYRDSFDSLCNTLDEIWKTSKGIVIFGNSGILQQRDLFFSKTRKPCSCDFTLMNTEAFETFWKGNSSLSPFPQEAL